MTIREWNSGARRRRARARPLEPAWTARRLLASPGTVPHRDDIVSRPGAPKEKAHRLPAFRELEDETVLLAGPSPAPARAVAAALAPVRRQGSLEAPTM